MEITQFMWNHGDILRELGWTVLVLIPKGNMDTRGIGLLEPLQKVVEAIIDICLRASVRLHYVLHGLCTGRVTGTVILELKLAQELSILDQEPMLLFFLDMRNSYDTVDCGRLLTMLEGYGAVTCM